MFHEGQFVVLFATLANAVCLSHLFSGGGTDFLPGLCCRGRIGDKLTRLAADCRAVPRALEEKDDFLGLRVTKSEQTSAFGINVRGISRGSRCGGGAVCGVAARAHQRPALREPPQRGRQGQAQLDAGNLVSACSLCGRRPVRMSGRARAHISRPPASRISLQVVKGSRIRS